MDRGSQMAKVAHGTKLLENAPLVSEKPFLGCRVSELRRFGITSLKETTPKKSRLHQLALGTRNSPQDMGIRQYLNEEEGEGYWDAIEVRKGLFLTITDAHYLKRAEMKLPPEPLIKIRVILSGSIREIGSERVHRAGEVSVQSFAGDMTSGYTIEPSGEPLQMVVLHCQTRAFAPFAEALQNAGAPFAQLAKSGATSNQSISLGSSMGIIQIARHIFVSRDQFIPAVRHLYLAAKADELLCWAIEKSRPKKQLAIGANRLRQRDIVRLHEVRSIILSDCADVPPLKELSRMAAMNSTKIKLGFKELFGETIGAFTQRVRMQAASQLIETTDMPLSQVAFKVGYSYPANFTKAFKQQFGITPSNARQSKLSAE